MPARNAAIGGAIWVVLTAASVIGVVDSLGPIEIMFLLAPLTIVPLGLLQVRQDIGSDAAASRIAWLGRLAPFVACGGVASFLFPPGTVAGVLAASWTLFTFAVGACGAIAFIRGGWRSVDGMCRSLACAYIPVGGLWLAVSRQGMSVDGFEEPIVLLTAVHFHYAGFAAPLIAAGTDAFARGSFTRRMLFRFGGIGIVTATPLIAAGFVFSPLLQIVSVVWLTLGLFAIAALQVLAAEAIGSSVAKLLLAVSGGSIVVGMLFAVFYAIGEYAGTPLIEIPQMAVTHGIINGLGFVLCGLAGLAIARKP